MLSRNEVANDDLISILFTATDDLTATFPATPARLMGLGDVPLLSARESALPRARPAASGSSCTWPPSGPGPSSATSTSRARSG